MTFFFRNMRALIDDGHVFLASPPLYRLVEGRDSVHYVKDGNKLARYFAKRLAAKYDLYLYDKKGRKVALEADDVLSVYKEFGRYHDAVGRASRNHGVSTDLISEIAERGDIDGYDSLVSTITASMESPRVDGNVISGVRKDEFVSVNLTESLLEELDGVLTVHGDITAQLEGHKGVFSLCKKGVQPVDTLGMYELYKAANIASSKGIQCTYLKGLGEMSPEQLWETTLDPARRTLIRLSVNDFDETGQLVSTLMGDKPELRREVMEANVEQYPREALDI